MDSNILTLFIFILGSVFASFACVAADRCMRNDDWLSIDRSHCMACGKKLSVLELIPIFSYLYQRGKCRTCGAKIPAECFFSELSLAVLWSAAFVFYGLNEKTLVFSVMSFFLLFHALTDRKEGNIYVTWGYAGIIAIILARFCFCGIGEITYYLFSAAVGYSIIYIVNFFYGEAMGEGDAYLLASAGGAFGLKYLYFFLLIGILILLSEAAVGWMKDRNRNILGEPAPFAPALYIGSLPALWITANTFLKM